MAVLNNFVKFFKNPGDPFFAHCRQHTDKDVVKNRRRKYLLAYSRCHRLRQLCEMEKKDAYSIDALEDFATANNDPKSKFSFLDCRLKEKLEYFRRLYNAMLSKREVPYSMSTSYASYFCHLNT